MKNQNIVLIIVLVVLVIFVAGTGVYLAVRSSAAGGKKKRYGCVDYRCVLKKDGKYLNSTCNNECGAKPNARYGCEDDKCVLKKDGKYRNSTCNDECGAKPNARYGCVDYRCVLKKGGKYLNDPTCNDECAKRPDAEAQILEGVKNLLTSVCSGVGGDPADLKAVLRRVYSLSQLRANAFDIDMQINKCYKGDYQNAFNILITEITMFLVNVDDKAYAALYACMTGDNPPSTIADLLACVEKANASSSILGSIEDVLVDLCRRGFNKSQTTTLRTIFANIKTFQDLANQAGNINSALRSCFNRSETKSIMGVLVGVISEMCTNSSQRLCANLNNCALSINQDNPDLANFIVCLARALLAVFS